MTPFRLDTRGSMLLLLTLANVAFADLQDFLNLQHRRGRLPETKFGYGEYSEYPDVEERQHGPETDWNRITYTNIQPGKPGHPVTQKPVDLPEALDPNILWDTAHWKDKLDIGQLSAVDLDPQGNVAVFSRGERIWGLQTFDYNNKFDCNSGPITRNTIFLFDRYGKSLLQWGRNMFYMPHGLTIDFEGNYWLTDVALHQVFKFDAKDIEKNWQKLKSEEKEPAVALVDLRDHQSRFNLTTLKPSMVLGEAFEPGDDNKRFCKPTAVAVAENGDFFVSDGYCNARIIKFNREGVRILTWGRTWSAADKLSKSPPTYALYVPHALALDNKQNLIYVADREDGRVMCYNSLNGSFLREYKNPVIGSRVYSIAYTRGRIYLVNGQDVYSDYKFHVRGFVVDAKSGEVVSQFAPGRNDMLAPHDITVSEDGSEIYVIELDSHDVYRFTQVVAGNKTTPTRHHESAPLTDDGSGDVPVAGSGAGPLILSIMISSMLFIGLCLAIAVVVARCQKRGCLLSVRRRAYWEAERRENFKLSSLLEPRQGKSFKILEKRPNTRDFSKLNTEPETSEDERVEDSLVI